MQRTLSVLAIIAVAGTLSAQRTWTVDSTGNGDFRTLTAAFAKASDGDAIRVLAGQYSETPQTSKALAVIGIGRPRINGLTITGLPASKSFTLKGIGITSSAGSLTLSANQGRVHLEDVVIPPALTPLAGTFNAYDCKLVSVTGSDLTGPGAASLRNSTVYFTNTLLHGTDAFSTFMFSLSANPALYASQSYVVLAETSCIGGNGTNGSSPLPPAPGIVMSGSDVFVTGSSKTYVVAGGSPTTYPVPAINARSGGKLYLDPDVKLLATNTTQLVKGITPVQVTIPALVATGAARGQTVRTELFAPSGWVAGLFVGLPGKRRLLAPLGDLWLDSNTAAILLDVGTVPATGVRVVNVPMPSNLPLGIAACFQAATLRPSSTLQLSTGATVVLH